MAFKKAFTKIINGVQAKIAGGLAQEENIGSAVGGEAFPGMAELVRGIAAEGGAIVAGGEHVLHLFPQHTRAYGQSPAQPLGSGDNIGRDAVVHV